jgi:hypothetical protein
MNGNHFGKKGLVVGIIMMFLGTSIITNFTVVCSEPSKSSDQPSIQSLGCPQPSYGNPPYKEWEKTFGGSNYDHGHSVEQTADGGYIITGYTKSYGRDGEHIWLIKTDRNGSEQWNKTLENNSCGFSVKQTIDGGYIIAGDTYAFGTKKIILIKTYSNGMKEWQNTFSAGNEVYCRSLDETSDGDYIVTGTGHGLLPGAYYYVFLLKADSNGNMLWMKTFGSNNSWGNSVRSTSDQGYIVTGSTVEYGAVDRDVWLIKTDRDGNEEWNKTFNGPGNKFDGGADVQQTSDEGYIITGHTGYPMNYSVDSNVWLVKTDNNGYQQWNRTFGGVGWDEGFSVDQTADDGYVIAGETKSFGDGESDIWVIRTNDSGIETWNITLGGSNEDIGESVQQTSDKGFIIAGRTSSYGAGWADAWLIKLTENEAPNQPTIDGQQSGRPCISYSYDVRASDPEGDEVYYWIEWGDGSAAIQWIGPYQSGQIITVSHTFSKKGTFIIKCQTKDVYGKESDWGTLSVTMPYSYNIQLMQFWTKLLERFPNTFPILRHLMGY